MSITAPTKLEKPFADNGARNVIPVASQIGIDSGAASFTDGFPPLTRTPVAAGGIPPKGVDMNGILYVSTSHIQWINAGGQYSYDPEFAAAIGGYPAGARLAKVGLPGSWYNQTDSNTTDPDAGGAGWIDDSGILVLSAAPVLQLARTIYAEDREQILRWKTLGAYTGYVSPDVGCISFGTQPDPRPFEVDLIGQTLDKTNPKYAALHAWGNAMGRFVAAGSWTAGTYFFCEMGGNLFRVPDLRNMFIRFTGTDIDTANARALGTKQGDAIRNILGRVGPVYGPGISDNSGSLRIGLYGPQPAQVGAEGGSPGGNYRIDIDAGLTVPTALENRPTNIALHPRMRL